MKRSCEVPLGIVGSLYEIQHVSLVTIPGGQVHALPPDNRRWSITVANHGFDPIQLIPSGFAGDGGMGFSVPAFHTHTFLFTDLGPLIGMSYSVGCVGGFPVDVYAIVYMR